MTDNHPITPPPELVEAFLRSNQSTPAGMTYEQFIATRFARWGADLELAACCEEIESFWDNEDVVTLDDILRAIRTARRPQPPSLKERIATAIAHGDYSIALALLDQALPD